MSRNLSFQEHRVVEFDAAQNVLTSRIHKIEFLVWSLMSRTLIFLRAYSFGHTCRIFYGIGDAYHKTLSFKKDCGKKKHP